MILLDTHILIWWVSGSGQLSANAKRAIDTTLNADREVIVSSISVWEIAMLINRGRLVLSMDIDNWIGELTQIEGLGFIPVDNEIGVKSTKLPGRFHKDPADRMIVATAHKFAVPLVTADEKIRNYEHVRSIW